MLDGLTLLVTEGDDAGMRVLKRGRACLPLRAHLQCGRHALARLVCQAAIVGWDWETWRLFSARQVGLARTTVPS